MEHDLRTHSRQRRSLIAGTAAACLGVASHRFGLAAEAPPLVFAQSMALSGPLADLGQAMHNGALACFKAVNAAGGVAGRRIELQTLDDSYNLSRAIANYKSALADTRVFGLFNCMGTAMNEALLPMIRNTDMPYFAPFTGASSARPADMRNVFNIRASYSDEARRLVEHLATVAMNKIAVAHLNDAFGREVLQSAERAMQHWSLKPAAVAPIENSTAEVQPAVDAIVAAHPQAVLIGLAGKPALRFVQAIRRKAPGLPLYMLSIMGASATLNALGGDATGIVVSQVMPLPTNPVTPVVRNFRQAWHELGVQQEPSHIALEGYVNARVLVEVLQRAGQSPTRSRVIEAAWSLKHLDLGGYELGFTRPGASASRFVELTMVRQGGKFIR